MYSLEGYGTMVADAVRMDAYREALRRTVTPESVVLDIGTGTGIMALMAAELGARVVVAVEPSPLIHVAARIAAENGLADRIRFVQGRSQELELPERADVIVSDLRGVLPLDPRHLPAVVDARTRLLAPGGTLIPIRDTVRVTAVEDVGAWRALTEPWRRAPYGYAMESAAQAALNLWGKMDSAKSTTLTAVGELAVLDYRTIENHDLKAEVELEVVEPGALHGFIIWFDGELVDGVMMSNAPGRPPTVYGQAFFPLVEPAVVEPGWRVRLRVRALLTGEEYSWFWRFSAADAEGREQARSAPEQSTLLHSVPSPRVAPAIADGDAPTLAGDGPEVRELLGLMDGRRTVRELADVLAERFPERFADGAEALEIVREVVQRYGSRSRGPAAGDG